MNVRFLYNSNTKVIPLGVFPQRKSRICWAKLKICFYFFREEYTINPEQLFFIEYESDYSFVPWKDLIKVVGMIVLVCYSYYQMMQIRLEIDEIQTVEDQLTVNHEEVMAIESFYKDAEQQFTTLEKQSTGLQKRFTKADILSKQNKEFEKIKEDIDFVQSSWFAQYSSFGLLVVSLKETSICDREVMVQLTEIKAMFDKELEKIESYMDEDLMALDRVLRGATQHMSWADMMEM